MSTASFVCLSVPLSGLLVAPTGQRPVSACQGFGLEQMQRRRLLFVGHSEHSSSTGCVKDLSLWVGPLHTECDGRIISLALATKVLACCSCYDSLAQGKGGSGFHNSIKKCISVFISPLL